MTKKTIIIGTVAVCLLLTSSVTAFAAKESIFPGRNGFDFGSGTFSAGMESRREDMKAKLAEIKKSGADMSVYEQYGLTYDEGKDGWCYAGKLVGLFVDKNGRGITFLSKDGEVHLKAVRDESGNLTGLAELTVDEYAVISSGMEEMRDDMITWMDEMFDRIENHMAKRHEMFKSFLSEERDPAALKETTGEIRKKMEQQREQLKNELEQRIREREQRMNELFDSLEQQ